MKLIDYFLNLKYIYENSYFLYEKLAHEPVAYHADYKVQKCNLPSGAKSLMVSKFCTTERDFKSICDIVDPHIVHYPCEIQISMILKDGGWIRILNEGNPVLTRLTRLVNYEGNITKDLKKDEYFNIITGYDIPYEYDDIMKVLDITKDIKHEVWMYMK